MKLNIKKCEAIRQMIAEEDEGPGLKKIIISLHLKTCLECRIWSVQNKKAEEYNPCKV